jgi:uncharacterized protein with HEPN domain
VPRRHWRVRIQDMLGAIANIRRFVASVGDAGFVKNDVAFSAVAYQVIIVGEAADNVPDAIRARHPEIPWDDLRDLRNFATHAYFAVAAQRLWQAVHEQVFPVEDALRAVLDFEA